MLWAEAVGVVTWEGMGEVLGGRLRGLKGWRGGCAVDQKECFWRGTGMGELAGIKGKGKVREWHGSDGGGLG